MTEHAVVIAGGGPTGLMLAGELALAGVDVVVVERRASQELDGSRAGGLHSRTIEVLDQRGIAERFLVGRATVMQIAGVRRDPAGHQRLPDPPQLRARALAEPHRAHPGRLGRRARRADPPRPRGGRASRRTTPASTSSCPTARRCGRDYLVGCDGGRSLVRKAAGIDFPGLDPSTSWMIAEVEMDEEPELGFRRDGVGIDAIGRRQDGGPYRRRAHRAQRRPRRRARRWTTSARRSSAVYGTDFGLHSADLDLPVHRHDAAGRVLPRAAGCCSPATPPTCTPRRAARASTSACRTP